MLDCAPPAWVSLIHGIHALAVAGARRDALEVPVAAVVGGVLGVAVGVRRIAAVSVERDVEVGQLRGGREGGAVDVGVDGVGIGGGINADHQPARAATPASRPEGERCGNSFGYVLVVLDASTGTCAWPRISQ